MIHRTELVCLHILDLLELLHASPSGEGSLMLVVGGEEISEFDFEELCIVLKIVLNPGLFDGIGDEMSYHENILPIRGV